MVFDLASLNDFYSGLSLVSQKDLWKIQPRSTVHVGPKYLQEVLHFVECF